MVFPRAAEPPSDLALPRVRCFQRKLPRVRMLAGLGGAHLGFAATMTICAGFAPLAAFSIVGRAAHWPKPSA
jgi:hypothetical protein